MTNINSWFKKERPLLGLTGFGGGAGGHLVGGAGGVTKTSSSDPLGHEASGGVIAEYAHPNGNVYRSHTFVAPGSFTITALSGTYAATVDAGGIGGGGGGGRQHGGGGGAGGFQYFVDANVSATSYAVTIGRGGYGSLQPGPAAPRGQPGTSTECPLGNHPTEKEFYGGGGGGSYSPTDNTNVPGGAGASGGGGGSVTSGGTAGGASGNRDPGGSPIPSQGQPGGAGGSGDSPNRGGGGGGNGGAGADAPGSTAGTGGSGGPDQGLELGPTNSNTFAAGGGGGGGGPTAGVRIYGGNQSGGAGGLNPSPTAPQLGFGMNAVASSGSGGGGGGPNTYPGGCGSSGRFYVRYQIGTVAGNGSPADSTKATGGNVSFYDDKWIHVFQARNRDADGIDEQVFNNTSGEPLEVEYVVIGGGGAGANPAGYVGGGGAGGYRTGTLTVAPGPQPVRIGRGGMSNNDYNNSVLNSGFPSRFVSIEVSGGGAGGGKATNPGGNADNRNGIAKADTPTIGGGSGGGACSYAPN